MTDELFYGGGKTVPITSEEGVSNQFFAPIAILSNEIDMNVLAPGELGDNDRAAAVITFKGRDAYGKGMAAVTIILDPDGLIGLVRMGRVKYTDIPLELR